MCEVNSPLVLVPGGPFEVVGSELLPAYVSEILGSLSVQCSDGCEMLGGCGFITICLIQHLCYSELTGGVLWEMAEESVQSSCKLVSSVRIQATGLFHQSRPKPDYFRISVSILEGSSTTVRQVKYKWWGKSVL